MATSTDVDALWQALRRARQDGDAESVRALEARMRQLAGHDDDRAHRHRDAIGSTPPVIVSPLEAGGG
jgi:hypothetical protein